MLKALSLLALAAVPTAATSDSDILAAVPDVDSFSAWANSYLRTTMPGVLAKLAGCCDYSDDYISDGGNDVFDGGNFLQMRVKGGAETNDLTYTRSKGPKKGALQDKTSNGVDITYATAYMNTMFVGIFKGTNGEVFDRFLVHGEMGTTNDESAPGSGAFTFNNVAYEYFFIYRQEDSDKGKYDLVVIDSEDGGKHCMNKNCYDSDYDYHRVWDSKGGFTNAGYLMFGVDERFMDSTSTYMSDGTLETFSATTAKYLAALCQNML